jgi:predicted nucleic acid-binding protein
MKYVLDASVGFEWVVPETNSDKAIRLRDDYRNAVIELLAPDIFPLEVAHALTRAERQNRITPAQGAQALADLLSLHPQLHPPLPFLPRAYQISSQMRVGVFDCLYVALAERERCQFITADDRLVRALQQQFPFVVPLSSLP